MYNHNLIEQKWQKIWKDENTFKSNVNDSKKKFYVLDMFPYPSGKGLHVGHPKGYSATDVISRYKRISGYSVIHPIGWDAFGLPAEQYALETKNHPKLFIEQNINVFRQQLQKLGFDYDYSREVNTTDPKYYRWTQWIFSRLFENGLAEIREIDVNWCEELKTTLSNEELVINKNGKMVSERGGFEVTKRPMKQWVLKITKYADKLLAGLDDLDWPDSLKNLQRNWIGKQEGFKVNLKNSTNTINLDIFVEEISNLINLEAVIISTKNPILKQLNVSKEVDDLIISTATKNDRLILNNSSKKTLKLPLELLNPVTKKTIQVYVCDYIITSTKGIFNNRKADDFDFFTFDKKIKTTISEETINKLIAEKIIIETIEFKLRDWVFSRQRYWGEPFPILFDKKGLVSLDLNLPILLPETQDFKPSSTGLSPLSKIDDFINVTINEIIYKRESNTMPQWAGSCWYYLGYLLKQANGNYIDLNSEEAKEIFKKWLPVDIYVGGQEHAVLHLLYARFWHHFLFDIGVVSTKEPFQKVINQGMILNNGEKMSKSKGNVINPNDIIESHGADALRIYELFMGPLTATLPWTADGLNGIRKWLDRVYRMFEPGFLKIVINEDQLSEKLLIAYNKFIQQFCKKIEHEQFNIAISEMMVFINEIYINKIVTEKYLNSFLILFSCFAPHLAEELWERKNEGSVCWQKLPTYEESKLINKTINIPFQINGKVKEILYINKDATETEIKDIISKNKKIQILLKNKKIIKEMIFPNKIINYILEGDK